MPVGMWKDEETKNKLNTPIIVFVLFGIILLGKWQKRNDFKVLRDKTFGL